MSTVKHIVCPHCHSTNRVPAERLAEEPKCGVCHRPLMDGRPLELDEAHFKRHISQNDIPVLVDFWAPWCGPCHMMAPAFAQAAQTLKQRARLAKVNTEQHQSLAMQYGIRSIPTLILFRQGREVARTTGAMDAGNLVAWTQRHGATGA